MEPPQRTVPYQGFPSPPPPTLLLHAHQVGLRLLSMADAVPFQGHHLT